MALNGRKDLAPLSLDLAKELDSLREKVAPTSVAMAAGLELREKLMPSSLAAALGAQQAIAEHVRPFARVSDLVRGLEPSAAAVASIEAVSRMGLPSVAAFQPMHDVFASKLGFSAVLADSWRRFDEIAGLDRTWASMTKASLALHAEDTLGLEIRRMKRLNGLLGGHLAPASHSAWSQHLKALALPSAAFLGHEWSSPTALLAEVAGPARGASVSWLERRDGEPGIVTAGIVMESVERKPTVAVDVEVELRCAICDGEMLEANRSGHLIGPKRVVQVRVIPVCPECLAEGRDDPAIWFHAIQESKRPALRLLRGEAQGDGVGVGHLRLVRTAEDDDEAVE